MNSLKKINEKIIHKISNQNNMSSEIMTPQLKLIFNKEAEQYYRSKNSVFKVDYNNQNYLNLICKYFAKDPSFEKIHQGSLHKGLFVHGEHGIGKTSSFKIIQNISRNYNLKQLWFPMISTSEVVQKFNTEKNKEFVIKNYSHGNFMFDDLGAEKEANNIFVFGKDEIFVRIFESRYNEFIKKGTMTHLTTNLSLEEIKLRYGKRIEDRFVEMFNFLKIHGNGRRDLPV